MKRMFVIYGQMNSGKTHTMWLVLNYLLEAGAEIVSFTEYRHLYTREEVLEHPESIGDFSALLEINNELYAIWSAGDELDYFEKKIKWANDLKADYVICSARSVDRRGSVYRKLMEDYRGDVLDDNDWFWVDIDESPCWLLKRDRIARHIADKIFHNTSAIMRRIVWPTGHGAFYTETFFKPAENVSVVYDCGGCSSSVVNKCIHDFVETTGVGTNKPIIRYLFISHFHRDHFCGIPELLKSTTVQNIIIPQIEHKHYVEAFVQNLTHLSYDEVADDATLTLLTQFVTGEGLDYNVVSVSPVNEKVQETDSVGDDSGYLNHNVLSGQQLLIKGRKPFALSSSDWVYIPVNVHTSKADNRKLDKLIGRLSEINVDGSMLVEDGHVNFDSLRRIAGTKGGLKTLKNIYKDIFGRNSNIHSMPVYSGPRYLYNQWCADICSNPAINDGYLDAKNYASAHYLQFAQKAVACLYMGDFVSGKIDEFIRGKTKLGFLRNQLGHLWYSIGALQIPHHTSEDNHTVELYRTGKICFANINNHGDVSFSHSVVRDIVREGSVPFIITENDDRLECWIYRK